MGKDLGTSSISMGMGSSVNSFGGGRWWLEGGPAGDRSLFLSCFGSVAYGGLVAQLLQPSLSPHVP